MMTEEERAYLLNRQIDQLLAGKTPDPQLLPSDLNAIQLASRLAQVMTHEEERIREEIRQKLLTRKSPENQFAQLKILFNRVRLSIFVQFTGWAVPALVLFTLFIYPVRMNHLWPGVNSNYQNPPVSIPINPAPSGITVTESTLSLRMPDPVPTPLAESSHFISTLPSAHLTKLGTTSIHPADRQVQTPKPAPLATDEFEP